MIWTDSRTFKALEGVSWLISEEPDWVCFVLWSANCQFPNYVGSPNYNRQYLNNFIPFLVSTMKQKIKMALCVRVLMLLIGPGLFYLLSNTFINKDGTPPTNDGKYANPSTIRSTWAQTVFPLSLIQIPLRHDNCWVSKITIHVMMHYDLGWRRRRPLWETIQSRKKQFQRILIQRPMDSNEVLGREVLGLCCMCWHHVIASWCWPSFATSTSLDRLKSCVKVSIFERYLMNHLTSFRLGYDCILISGLNMKKDVVGSTFMAMTTSSPELVVTCVGTFITEGDIGVGTVVGSAVFNILAVPAICAFFTKKTVQLESRSLRRDCIFYGCSIFALIAVIYDNQIMWYEAACLIVVYGIYLICNLKHFRGHSQLD